MGKTHAQKEKERLGRLGKLNGAQRRAKAGAIKQREGRVLDANEKHAVMMQGDMGKILRAWEVVRTQSDRMDAKMQEMRALTDDTAKADMVSIIEAASGEKHQAVDQLLSLVLPKASSYAKTPKGTRVLQSCVKLGTNEHRVKVLSALEEDFPSLVTDACGNFVFISVVRHCNQSLYRQLCDLLIKHMLHAVTNRFGIAVINAVYSHKFCTPTDRHMMTLGIFRDSTAVMKSWPGFPVLDDILAKDAKGQIRRRLLGSLYKLIDKLATQKNVYDVAFVQNLLNIYFKNGCKEEITELAATLKEHVIPFIQTREGSLLASQVFSITEPRNRKEMLRSVSQNFETFVTSKFGAPFVARVCDLVYDAQMNVKFLVAPFAANLEMLVASPYGHEILLHLLTPEDERKWKALFPNWKDHHIYSRNNTKWNHFTWLGPDFVAETVEIASKDAETNHLVLLKGIMKKLVELIAASSTATAEENPIMSSKQFKLHVSRIAKELSHCVATYPSFASALQLSSEQLEVIMAARPRKTQRQDGDDDDDEEEEVAQPVTKKSKKETPVRKSAASAVSVATTPKSARKSAAVAVAETPASSRKSSVKVAADASSTPVAASASAKKRPRSSSAVVDEDASPAVSKTRTPASTGKVKAKASATPARASATASVNWGAL